MNILFTAEYYYPYVHGGAEISISELAKALYKNGETIHILTPNYGTSSFEDAAGMKIHRFNFIKKLKNLSDQLSPSWYFNPFYIIGLFIQIIKFALTHHIKIIHVHGLFSLPSAVLAGKVLKIPVIVTFRDAQLLCNYGFCLTKNQFGQACNLKEYFFEDFRNYLHSKVENKNIFTFVSQVFFAIIGRARTKTLQYFAKQASALIVSSTSQQKTFAVNGFKTKVIHNIFSFSTQLLSFSPKEKIILYATKMSSGKGLDVLLISFKQVLREFPEAKLMIIGSGDKVFYDEIIRKLDIEKNVTFLGRKSPEEVMELRKTVLLEVCPSVYPESFGRTALEALASGVPVVASNRGGFTDIVEDGKTGYLVNPTVNELSGSIILAINNNQKLRKNISEEYLTLKNKFEIKPLKDHIKLYKSLIR